LGQYQPKNGLEFLRARIAKLRISIYPLARPSSALRKINILPLNINISSLDLRL
jgi:hypothetical protein